MANYYNKGGVYLRLTPEINEVLEVFTSPDQKRIILSTLPVVYQNTAQRIVDHGFTTITEQEFILVYLNVKSDL